MRTIKMPGQIPLFDVWKYRMSSAAYKYLTSSYYAVFRCTILELMPAEKLGERFHEALGRPTKELHAMAGLILLKEFNNWTTEKAVEQFMFNLQVHYALNLDSMSISVSIRTLERYMVLVKEDDIAAKIFENVTSMLIKTLDIEIDEQRLDSTHVFSDMALQGKTKLMISTIKRFLTQLKKHHKEEYASLPMKFHEMCTKSEIAIFAKAKKEESKQTYLRQHTAEMMNELITIFDGNGNIENMSTFKNLVTVFNQQCEVTVKSKVSESDENDSSESLKVDEKEVIVKKKTGGNVIQNSSDPDATFDGHKGKGYQVQLSETSNAKNDIQLITAVLPQTAVESDAEALVPVLKNLQEREISPLVLTADTLYGGDDNACFASENGCELISPVPGAPVKKELEAPDEKQKRLQKRRKEEETDEWRSKYKKRAQIEGTIGSIKRKTGMSKLRYRGKKSVFCSMILKVTGWNISMAVKSEKMQKILKKA